MFKSHIENAIRKKIRKELFENMKIRSYLVEQSGDISSLIGTEEEIKKRRRENRKKQQAQQATAVKNKKPGEVKKEELKLVEYNIFLQRKSLFVTVILRL